MTLTTTRDPQQIRQKNGFRSPTSHLDYVVDTNDNGKRDETQASIELKRNSDSRKGKT